MRRFARLGFGSNRGSGESDDAIADDGTVVDLTGGDRIGSRWRAGTDGAGAPDPDDDYEDQERTDTAEDAEARRAAELLERLLDGVNTRVLGDPVERVNERTPFVTRWSPLEFGFHDGLAAHPDGTNVTPSAIVTLRDEENERSSAIEVLQEQASVQLDVLVMQRRQELELVEHELHEAMYRVVARHPRGSRSGFYGTAEEAQAAITEARRIVAEREAEAERKRDEARSEPASVEDAAAPAPEPVEAEDSTEEREAATRTTEEQRIAASMELAWSIKWYWFWLGSIVLLAAEFPFMRAIVRQLLLERDPDEWIVLLSTASITVGFLIATKLTGLLLRRAQSMFLLAKNIDPTRQPWFVRVFRRSRGEYAQRKDTNPTEVGLRFGAWSRLVGALVLMAILFGTVWSIAQFRSEAASSVAAANAAAQSDRFGGSATDGAAAEATAEEELDAAFADVPLHTLQNVFVSVSLLNVVGAIALAWASTKVPWEELPPEEANDWSPTNDVEDPLSDESETDEDGVPPRRRTRRDRRNRARSRLGARLESDVSDCRKKVVEARTRLAAAEALRSHHTEHTRLLKDLSQAQGQLDESSYWWANRAGRRFELQPDTDAELAAIRDRDRVPGRSHSATANGAGGD